MPTQIPRAAWKALLLAPVLAPVLAAVSAVVVGRDLPQQDYDVIIEHGRVVDGTGAPWYAADVGIRDGHIVAIGRLDKAPAKQRIDAAGRIVAPGFIDMLGQSEITLLVDPHAPSKVFQGITTEITGEGNSVAPVNDAIAKERAAQFEHYQIKRDWSDFAGYFARLERQGIGINLASYVGATTVREMVIGYADRAATPSELIANAGARRRERCARVRSEFRVRWNMRRRPTPARKNSLRCRGPRRSLAEFMRPTCAPSKRPS